MARGGTPSSDYKTTVWNFHVERYVCPACGRKGVFRSNNNGSYYCSYKRLGCGKIFADLNKLKINAK
jgi:hypothetical protein